MVNNKCIRIYIVYIRNIFIYIINFFLDEEINKIDYLLVLEYADSGTLRQYLKKSFINPINHVKWEEQLNFAKEIASAISYLHHNEIIHRDLVSLIGFIIDNQLCYILLI